MVLLGVHAFHDVGLSKHSAAEEGTLQLTHVKTLCVSDRSPQGAAGCYGKQYSWLAFRACHALTAVQGSRAAAAAAEGILQLTGTDSEDISIQGASLAYGSPLSEDPFQALTMTTVSKWVCHAEGTMQLTYRDSRAICIQDPATLDMGPSSEDPFQATFNTVSASAAPPAVGLPAFSQ